MNMWDLLHIETTKSMQFNNAMLCPRLDGQFRFEGPLTTWTSEIEMKRKCSCQMSHFSRRSLPHSPLAVALDTWLDTNVAQQSLPVSFAQGLLLQCVCCVPEQIISYKNDTFPRG